MNRSWYRNWNIFLFLMLWLGFCNILAANTLDKMPEPYASIHVMPEFRFGYYSNANQIEQIFRENDIRTVIEVGSWIGGGSTLHFGALLNPKKGKLYAVDTWLGSSTQQEGQAHYQPILPQVYHQFLSNMIHWELTDTVIPVRMRSAEAAQTLKVKPDLIYIDGEHTTDAVYQDLTVWYPFGGILCGDDWSWDSVRLAVERFAQEKGLQIEASGSFWRFKR